MKPILTLLVFALALTAQTPTTVNLRNITWTTEAVSCAETIRITMGVSGNYALAADLASVNVATAPTLTLNDATGFPASGQLVIDNEAIGFTFSGGVITITNRSVAGTSRAAHAKGANVRLLQYANLPEAIVFEGAKYWQAAVSAPGACVTQAALDAAIATAQKARNAAASIQ